MITTIPTFRPSFLERHPRQILGLIALASPYALTNGELQIDHLTVGKVAALLRDFGVDEVVEGIGRTGVVTQAGDLNIFTPD